MAEVKRKEKHCDENGTITDENGNVLVEYSSNSNKSKINQEGVEAVKKKKIIAGEVVSKKSVGKEVKNSFAEAGNYVFQDIILPAIKNTVFDVIKNATEMVIYGETGQRRTRRDGNRTYVSYNDDSYLDRRRERPVSVRRKYIDDLILDSRADAEDVVDNLNELINDYGIATVANLYELVGWNTEYTDHDYGWTDLSRVNMRAIGGGKCLLEFPDPKPVK